MTLGLSLLITLALVYIPYFVFNKTLPFFIYVVLVFWWVIGAIIYFLPSGFGSILLDILMIIFYFINVLGIIGVMAGSSLSKGEIKGEDLRKNSKNITKAIGVCPKCLKKIPSYFTTKCPHCTADI